MKLPHFVPILSAFTARVAGRELSELLQSPNALARALADTQTVVGHDGVLCLFDPLLLASACIVMPGETATSHDAHAGSLRASAEILQSQPLVTLLGSIQPLQHHLQGRALVFAAFAGPGLLHFQLEEARKSRGETKAVDPDYVVDVIRTLTRSAFESKADGIALIERSMPATNGELLRCYKIIRKLADFYDAGFLAFRLHPQPETHTELHSHCVFDLPAEENKLGSVTGRLGPGITSNMLPITTTGDVPETTPVEQLKSLFEEQSGRVSGEK